LTSLKAREKHTYLKQFEHDWATADLVKQYLRNSRKYLIRQRQTSDPSQDSQHEEEEGDDGEVGSDLEADDGRLSGGEDEEEMEDDGSDE
jgi:hypothetical protein